MTTISKRIGEDVEQHFTRRVAIGGHGANYDSWGGSWGTSWLQSWFVFLSASEIVGATQRVIGTPSGSQSKRIQASASGGATKRVTAAPSSSITKRVTV